MAVLVCDKENQLGAGIGKLIRCQRYFRTSLLLEKTAAELFIELELQTKTLSQVLLAICSIMIEKRFKGFCRL